VFRRLGLESLPVSAVPLVVSSGQSHTGKYREENQDAIRIHEPTDTDMTLHYGYLYAVADGMGGYSHGGVASVLALDTFYQTFYAGQAAKSPQNLRQAIQAANLAVYQAAQRLGAVRMGTTLTALNLCGNQLHIAHSGDSRLYLVRERKARCLTNDHTHVGELVRMRVLSPDKVRTHERRSILNKCLGIQLFIQPDIARYACQADDILILCSDGVWSVIEDDEFARFATDFSDPTRLSQTLLDVALERDSDDNLSAVVVQIQQAAEGAETDHSRRWSFPKFIRGRGGLLPG
jgi:protein phosphatase